MKDEPVSESELPEQAAATETQEVEEVTETEQVEASVDVEEGAEHPAAQETDASEETEDIPEPAESESEEVEEVLDIAEIDISEAQEAPEEIRRAIEALILVADTPIPLSILAQLTEVSAATVAKVCQELAAEYEAENRGFVLVNVAGGFRFQTHTDLAPYIERFALEGQSSRLSAAALETLAIIAYKQPLSRAQVAAIRGVNADAVMRTLQQRGYIDEIAREEGQGLSVLFQTTNTFLERIGLSAIDELPALGDFAPGSEVVEALEQSLSAEPIDEELVRGEDAAADADITPDIDVAVDADTAPDVATFPDADISPDSSANGEPEGEEVVPDADSVDTRLDAVVIDLRDSVRTEHD